MPDAPAEKPIYDIATEVAELCEGTTKGAGDGLRDCGYDEELSTNAVFCARWDELVFVCETCGWTCRRDEESEKNPEHCDEHDDE